MSNGLNFNSLISIAEILAAPMTGGSSLLLSAASQALTQVGEQVMSSALDTVGIGGPTKDLVMGAFKSAVGDASGAVESYGNVSQDLVDKITDAANHQSSNGSYTGELDRAKQDATDQLSKFIAKMGQTEADGDVGKGSDSWLVAMAKAMGRMLGDKAQHIKELSQKIESEGSDAKAYNTDITELQGASQEYGIMSNAFSQVIKSIGEGLSGMARKQ